MKPTPIHKWKLPGVPDRFEVLIKREDLTGAALTGNKVCEFMYFVIEVFESIVNSSKLQT